MSNFLTDRICGLTLQVVEEISGYSYWPTSEEVAPESQGAGEYNYAMENFKGNYVTVSVTKGLKPVKVSYSRSWDWNNRLLSP